MEIESDSFPLTSQSSEIFSNWISRITCSIKMYIDNNVDWNDYHIFEDIA